MTNINKLTLRIQRTEGFDRIEKIPETDSTVEKIYNQLQNEKIIDSQRLTEVTLNPEHKIVAIKEDKSSVLSITFVISLLLFIFVKIFISPIIGGELFYYMLGLCAVPLLFGFCNNLWQKRSLRQKNKKIEDKDFKISLKDYFAKKLDEQHPKVSPKDLSLILEEYFKENKFENSECEDIPSILKKTFERKNTFSKIREATTPLLESRKDPYTQRYLSFIKHDKCCMI